MSLLQLALLLNHRINISNKRISRQIHFQNTLLFNLQSCLPVSNVNHSFSIGVSIVRMMRWSLVNLEE